MCILKFFNNFWLKRLLDFCCVTFLVVKNFPSAFISWQCLCSLGITFYQGSHSQMVWKSLYISTKEPWSVILLRQYYCIKIFVYGEASGCCWGCHVFATDVCNIIRTSDKEGWRHLTQSCNNFRKIASPLHGYSTDNEYSLITLILLLDSFEINFSSISIQWKS